MRRLIVSLVVVASWSAASVPAVAVIDDRGSVVGAATWRGSSDPGVPEAATRFAITASNEQEAAPECPSVNVCPPLGRALLVRDGLATLDVTITCLSIAQDEAFFAGYAPEDEHAIPVAGYVVDGSVEASTPARLAIRTGVGFACRGDAMRGELRAASSPVGEGALVVLEVCRVTVCPADRARPI